MSAAIQLTARRVYPLSEKSLSMDKGMEELSTRLSERSLGRIQKTTDKVKNNSDNHFLLLFLSILLRSVADKKIRRIQLIVNSKKLGNH